MHLDKTATKKGRRFLRELPKLLHQSKDGKALFRIADTLPEDWMRHSLAIAWVIGFGIDRTFQYCYETVLFRYTGPNKVGIVEPPFGPIPLPMQILDGTVLVLRLGSGSSVDFLFLNLKPQLALPPKISGEELIEAVIRSGCVCGEAGGTLAEGDFEIVFKSPEYIPSSIHPWGLIPRLSLCYLSLWFSGWRNLWKKRR